MSEFAGLLTTVTYLIVGAFVWAVLGPRITARFNKWRGK